jgi:hypothetical protein
LVVGLLGSLPVVGLLEERLGDGVRHGHRLALLRETPDGALLELDLVERADVGDVDHQVCS